MTPQARFRRIGWFAALAVCTALYLMLHLKVHSVSSDVIRAERQIVRLEQTNMLLETEFLTRSSQIQLASWNRVDFGYTAPRAEQFIENERQLEQFAAARDIDAPAPIQLARVGDMDDSPAFPRLVSPLTGEPLDDALVTPETPRRVNLAAADRPAVVRIPLVASASIADTLP